MDDARQIIILVDDNLSSLNQGKNILKPHYRVYPASSAEKLFETLENVIPDLILLDIEMPGMSGLEFLHAIRKNPKYMKIPIVVVTGHTEAEIVTRAGRSNISGVVYKPIHQEELFKKIEYALAHPPEGIFGL